MEWEGGEEERRGVDTTRRPMPRESALLNPRSPGRRGVVEVLVHFKGGDKEDKASRIIFWLRYTAARHPKKASVSDSTLRVVRELCRAEGNLLKVFGLMGEGEARTAQKKRVDRRTSNSMSINVLELLGNPKTACVMIVVRKDRPEGGGEGRLC